MFQARMDSIATLQRTEKRSWLRAVEKLRPLLQRSGIERSYEAIGEACLFLSHPLLYHRILQVRGHANRENLAIRQVIAWLDAVLAEQGIEAHFDGRLKRISSIYRKMQHRDLSPDAIHDLRGLRIIVPDRETCYRTLDLVHESYDPLPDQVDDYIAHPKANNYQSLHTVVADERGKCFEVQIRTPDMHQVAERGSAAHWRYKDSGPVPELKADRLSPHYRSTPIRLEAKGRTETR